ncbi:nuclear transport factor 2 family protein [Pediococcus parvulus]|uniref:nuclear transport factor 2 family protein n=1 Tax=Pediococcus parvulus TaxID=54062 RepID=UPI003CFC5690
MTPEVIIAEYFQMWITKDFSKLTEYFAPEICYTECYGPQYVGLDEVQQWIKNESAKQTVLEWQIDEIKSVDNQSFVKWFFKAHEQTTYEFDGVSVIQWNAEGKISKLDECQSKSDHIRPYQIK